MTDLQTNNGWLSDDKRWKIYRHLKRLEIETPNASLEEKTNSINILFDILAGKTTLGYSPKTSLSDMGNLDLVSKIKKKTSIYSEKRWED